MEDKFPNLPESPVALLPARDDFDTDSLRFCWNFLRTPFERWYELKNSRLYINLRPQKATELVNPSLIARRVEDHRFKAITSMNFKPSSVNEEAGMIIMQNDRFQYRLVLVGKGKTPQELRLILVKDGKEEILARVPYKINEVVLAVQGDGLKYSFLYGTSEDQLEFLGKDVDATVCSTNVAKGFIGPFVGMYASSNGKVSKNKAAFDWFSYSKY
ncbi:beta-xylosidase family glycoside hydrolase [Bacteroides stercorirosoris]|nr:hypothetical protein [Bacteroides stercorirosoris]